MKPLKNLLTILLIILPLSAHAWGVVPTSGGVAGGGASCMAGTYVASWDGSYPEDSDAACNGSGNKLDGTVTGSIDYGTDYGEGGGDIGMRLTAVNEYITYSNTGPLFNPSGAYTIWMRVYLSGNPAADMLLFASEYDSTNSIMMQVKSNGEAFNTYRADSIFSTWDDALTTGAWITIGYSWDYPNADHSGYSGGSWHDDDNELSAALAGTPTSFDIGARYSFPASGYVYITKWAIVNGYKASLPSGW